MKLVGLVWQPRGSRARLESRNDQASGRWAWSGWPRRAVGQAKYAPIIAPDGGIINDPVLLRRGQNTFWLCLADSDAHLYALGVAHRLGLDVAVSLPDAYPVQVQGPKSKQVMTDLVWSPRLQRNIGYVWVPAGLTGPGNDLEIEWSNGQLTPQDRSHPLPRPTQAPANHLASPSRPGRGEHIHRLPAASEGH
jgi:glycine cleavage system aminomethyltransferase T